MAAIICIGFIGYIIYSSVMAINYLDVVMKTNDVMLPLWVNHSEKIFYYLEKEDYIKEANEQARIFYQKTYKFLRFHYLTFLVPWGLLLFIITTGIKQNI